MNTNQMDALQVAQLPVQKYQSDKLIGTTSAPRPQQQSDVILQSPMSGTSESETLDELPASFTAIKEGGMWSGLFGNKTPRDFNYNKNNDTLTYQNESGRGIKITANIQRYTYNAVEQKATINVTTQDGNKLKKIKLNSIKQKNSQESNPEELGGGKIKHFHTRRRNRNNGKNHKHTLQLQRLNQKRLLSKRKKIKSSYRKSIRK